MKQVKITLPELRRILFKEKGNQIVQLIVPSIDVSVDIVTEDKNSLSIVSNNETYYLTSKGVALENESYVLRTSVRPSKSAFESNTAIIKNWLKHPDFKEYTSSEVLESWKGKFLFKEEDPNNESVKGLREPQIGALYNILGHLKVPIEKGEPVTGTVVMPTGTGKTETMLSALIAFRCPKLLVIVPSDALRRQISEKFVSLGLLKEFGIVDQTALYPIVGTLKKGFNSEPHLRRFLEQCNVIVTTINILASCSTEEITTIKELCSHVFIDEAHHVKAATWNYIKSVFSPDQVVQFTATPFRNDGKRLDGKIIFNFPLSRAQKQGYFRHIEFQPIREYNQRKGDEKIAEAAVIRLREDLSNGYNHILMARCSTKERADEVFRYYEMHNDLNPTKIYTGIGNKNEVYQNIVTKRAKIIVCVDMLGEGFDLPELKIAAFHDIRKSLPITLQFAGRFTRTKYDEELGNAVFIANIADLKVKEELAELYAQDANWNKLLADSSSNRITEELDFKALMAGFEEVAHSAFPFENIKPKLSTVVYKNARPEWFPANFTKGIQGYKDFEYKFHTINRERNMIVIIYAKRVELDWVHHNQIYELSWNLILVFWETRNNLLFINSTDNSSLYVDLARAIIGDDAQLIKGIDVFKSFYGINRVKLQNVGLKYFLGKDVRFRMSVGSDVGEALSIAERQRGEKAFVMGVGYEKGNPVNIGASYKGRIWTRLVGNLLSFSQWCSNLGNKLVNPNIDPNQILKETLIPERITNLPGINPVWIDWDIEMYLADEKAFKFKVGELTFEMWEADIALVNTEAGSALQFSISSEYSNTVFEKQLYLKPYEGGEQYPDFRIVQVSGEVVEVVFGKRTFNACAFFEEYIPTIWFADGSALTGNDYIKLKHESSQYPIDEIIEWDWIGVDLRREAQGVPPKDTTSIQYKVIQELKNRDYDIIYDDDFSGEIADIVTLKVMDEHIQVELYHLKYAKEGKISGDVGNFYEVCGQAQKSVHWKHRDGRHLLNHLLRRETKSRKGSSCTRLEHGSIADLEKILKMAKVQIPIQFEIFIVQPGFSKATATLEILTLLGVTESFIKEVAGINLRVIGNR